MPSKTDPHMLPTSGLGCYTRGRPTRGGRLLPCLGMGPVKEGPGTNLRRCRNSRNLSLLCGHLTVEVRARPFSGDVWSRDPFVVVHDPRVGRPCPCKNGTCEVRREGTRASPSVVLFPRRGSGDPLDTVLSSVLTLHRNRLPNLINTGKNRKREDEGAVGSG